MKRRNFVARHMARLARPATQRDRRRAEKRGETKHRPDWRTDR